MIEITREQAQTKWRDRGLEAYNGYHTLLEHQGVRCFQEQLGSGLILVDKEWFFAVDTKMDSIVQLAKELHYKEVAMSGVRTHFYEEAISDNEKIVWEEFCHLYSYEGTVPQYEVPQGFIVDSLSQEDAEIVNQYYTYQDEKSLSYIQENIKNRESVGIKTTEGELASWVTVHPDGTMGIMYTKEEFRRKKLGQIASLAMMKKLMEKGQIPYVHIAYGNEASIGLATKLGLRHQFDIVWFGVKLYE